MSLKRILLFSGKGGVGKTSLAAASGLRLSQLGYRTLIMSVDPAHSLGDAFDISGGLFHGRTFDPLPLGDKLFIQEVNIHNEVRRHWSEISAYVTAVLRTTGLSDIEAEELAILPGMEELSSMMYVNQYRKNGDFDVIILDCAPTAESLRFVTMPTTLDWYMKHIFPFQRSVLKAVRPIANKVAPFELPKDSYFANIKRLFERLAGIDEVLENPQITSIRLVTNPEKMVLKETQRAFVYFSLHGLTVDAVLMNRVLPPEAGGGYFSHWMQWQSAIIEETEQYFNPIPVRKIPLFAYEVLGMDHLERLADILYPSGEDPAAVLRTERSYSFRKTGQHYEVLINLPFATKGEVGLFKKSDELVVEIGSLRRHIGLPTAMAALVPVKARLENQVLTVEMKEA